MFRQIAVRHFTALRNLCHDVLSGYNESIAYGMPTYAREGRPEIAFASQKNHIAMYMKLEVLKRHRDEVPDCGKGCVRYRKPEQVDSSRVKRLLQDTAASPTIHSLNVPTICQVELSCNRR